MSIPRQAFSMIEVIVATATIVIILVPLLGMMSTTSAEIATTRDGLVAASLATCLMEDLKSEPPAQRREMAPTPAVRIPPVRNLMEAHWRAAPNGGHPEEFLQRFECQVGLTRSAGDQLVQVTVRWHEAGYSRQYALETHLGAM